MPRFWRSCAPPTRKTRTTSRSAALAALLLLALGCGGEPTPDVASGDPALLTMSEAGAGQVTAQTAFSPEALREALPEGFEIETGQLNLADDTVPVLYAFSDGHMILEVYPDRSRERVRRIDASSERVAGPTGARAGALFSEVGGRQMTCAPGTEDLAGRALCEPGGGGRVRYVFAHGAETARGELPSDDVLAQSILERIVWTAP